MTLLRIESVEGTGISSLVLLYRASVAPQFGMVRGELPGSPGIERPIAMLIENFNSASVRLAAGISTGTLFALSCRDGWIKQQISKKCLMPFVARVRPDAQLCLFALCRA